MEVKCINISDYEKSLTKGKVYEVIKEDKGMYFIINNKGETYGYYKERFEIIEDGIVSYEFKKSEILVINESLIEIQNFYKNCAIELIDEDETEKVKTVLDKLIIVKSLIEKIK